MIINKRQVFDEIGLFDENLSTREPVHISLSLFKANIPIVFEPRARLNFYPPPPVKKDELEFYSFVWDLEKGKRSHKYIAKKWNLNEFPESLEFIEGQHHRTSTLKWARYRFPMILSKVKKYGLPGVLSKVIKRILRI